MGGHVLDDVAHVMVGERVEDLLSLPLGSDEAGGTKQAQVMADERRAQAQRLRDFADRACIAGNGQRDAEPGRVTEQAEDLRKLVGLIRGQHVTLYNTVQLNTCLNVNSPSAKVKAVCLDPGSPGPKIAFKS